MAQSLNLILGHSARTAISLMERDCEKEVLCVVSPSPRAERRFSDDDMILVFTSMGEIMKRLTRFEAHFYSSNLLWLPAQALTGFLRTARKLERFLLNGVRVKGTDEEIAELGLAFQEHPTLRESTFFNIAPHREADKVDPCLRPMLEGVARNPNHCDLTLRFVTWSNPFLRVLTDSRSKIPSLRLSGKETLYGPEGDGINMGAPDLLDALKNNTALREIRINQCAAPIGMGARFGAMLRANKHLKKLFLHITNYDESIHIARALAHENKTLTHLELFVEDPRKRGIIDVEAMRPEINRAVEVFEESLATNGRLVHVKLFCRNEVHNSDKMNFFTRMNLAGRFSVICNDELTPEGALTYVMNHNEDHSLIYYILGMKPSLMPLLMQAAKAPPSKRQAIKKYYDSSDDEDELPIARLKANAQAKKAKAAAKNKRSSDNKKRSAQSFFRAAKAARRFRRAGR